MSPLRAFCRRPPPPKRSELGGGRPEPWSRTTEAAASEAKLRKEDNGKNENCRERDEVGARKTPNQEPAAHFEFERMELDACRQGDARARVVENVGAQTNKSVLESLQAE